MTFEENRKESFDRIFGAIRAPYPHTVLENNHIVINADSEQALKHIPPNSIDLILTDPPYHSTKKANIVGDTDFESDRSFLDWMNNLVIQWRRILRPNGSIYVFCSPRMVGRIEALMYQDFRVYPSITWTKPNDPGFDGWKQKMDKNALRIWYPHSEKIIFAEPAVEGNLFRSTLAKFLKETRIMCGLSTYELTEATGAYGKVNHGGAVSNWEAGRNTPSEAQYESMCRAFKTTGKVTEMPDYYDVVRPFEVDVNSTFTDIWDFPNIRPYKGKHPAEKPTDMLSHIISTSSRPGSVVLDCFGGSGSTACSAKTLGRRSITIEIDSHWYEASISRIKAQSKHKHRHPARKDVTDAHLLLFSSDTNFS